MCEDWEFRVRIWKLFFFVFSTSSRVWGPKLINKFHHLALTWGREKKSCICTKACCDEHRMDHQGEKDVRRGKRNDQKVCWTNLLWPQQHHHNHHQVGEEADEDLKYWINNKQDKVSLITNNQGVGAHKPVPCGDQRGSFWSHYFFSYHSFSDLR